MSDLLPFYRDSEPWIVADAVTKYGHPEHDRELLEDLSLLTRAHRIAAPLLELPGEGHVYRRAGSRVQLATTLVRFHAPHLGVR